MRKQHVGVGRNQERLGTDHLGTRIGGHGEIRHVRRHFAREPFGAEQADRMVLQYVGGAGEAHISAFFDLRLVHPGIMKIAKDRIGVHAGDAVGNQAHVQLELAQRSFGVGAESPADAAAGEPEGAEGRLQLLDVFTGEVRGAQIQQALAQLELLAFLILPTDSSTASICAA